MFGRSGWCLLVAAVVILGSAGVAGQADSPGRVMPRVLYDGRPGEIRPGRLVPPFRTPLPPLRVVGFPQFVRAAGTIFSGTVTKIERLRYGDAVGDESQCAGASKRVRGSGEFSVCCFLCQSGPGRNRCCSSCRGPGRSPRDSRFNRS